MCKRSRNTGEQARGGGPNWGSGCTPCRSQTGWPEREACREEWKGSRWGGVGCTHWTVVKSPAHTQMPFQPFLYRWNIDLPPSASECGCASKVFGLIQSKYCIYSPAFIRLFFFFFFWAQWMERSRGDPKKKMAQTENVIILLDKIAFVFLGVFFVCVVCSFKVCLLACKQPRVHSDAPH